MKTFLAFLIVFLGVLVSSAQDIPGTVIAAKITTGSTNNTFSIGDTAEMQGTPKHVATTVLRDLIPAERRAEGMEVWVTNSATVYRLVGGTNNSNWQDVTQMRIATVRPRSGTLTLGESNSYGASWRGAYPVGTTWDAIQIQEAIYRATGGLNGSPGWNGRSNKISNLRILLEPGTYDLAGWTLRATNWHGVHFGGSSERSAIVTGTNTLFHIDGMEYCVIHDVQFSSGSTMTNALTIWDGNGDTTGLTTHPMQGNLFQNVVWENSGGDIQIGMQVTPTYGQGSENLLENCYFFQFRFAGAVWGGYNALQNKMHKGNVQGCNKYGIYLDGATMMFDDVGFQNGVTLQTGWDVYSPNTQGAPISMKNCRSESARLAWAGNSRMLTIENCTVVPAGIDPIYSRWTNTFAYSTNVGFNLAIPSIPNGHMYKVIQNGTNGLTEPVWPMPTGATEWTARYVTNGSIVWEGFHLPIVLADNGKIINSVLNYGTLALNPSSIGNISVENCHFTRADWVSGYWSGFAYSVANPGPIVMNCSVDYLGNYLAGTATNYTTAASPSGSYKLSSKNFVQFGNRPIVFSTGLSGGDDYDKVIEPGRTNINILAPLTLKSNVLAEGRMDVSGAATALSIQANSGSVSNLGATNLGVSTTFSVGPAVWPTLVSSGSGSMRIAPTNDQVHTVRSTPGAGTSFYHDYADSTTGWIETVMDGLSYPGGRGWYDAINGKIALAFDTNGYVRIGSFGTPAYSLVVHGTQIVASALSSNAAPVNTLGQLADGTFVKIANASAGSNTGNVYSASALTSGNLVQGGGGNNVSDSGVAAGNLVAAAATIPDNDVLRGDGGSRGAQKSGMTVDDSTNATAFSFTAIGDIAGSYLHSTGDGLIDGDFNVTGSVIGGVVSASSYILPNANIRFLDALLAPSSQLTNYTVDTALAERTINATNHVHFATVQGATSGSYYFCGVTITNGSSKTLSFDPAMVPLADTYTNLLNATVRVVFQIGGSVTYYQVSR